MSHSDQVENYWNDDHDHQYDSSPNRSFDELNGFQEENDSSSHTEEMIEHDSDEDSNDDNEYSNDESSGDEELDYSEYDADDIMNYIDERVNQNYESLIQKYSTRPTSVCMVNLLMLGVGALVTAIYTKECYPVFM